MINKTKSDRCIRCHETEDWLHIITCKCLSQKRRKWVQQVNKEIAKVEKNKTIRKDASIFINDIHDFMNGENDVPGSQNIIGFKQLFRGYIVKDWFDANVDETKYATANKVIIKECVMFYNQCWKERNELVQKDTQRKVKLLNEVAAICTKYEHSTLTGVMQYLRQRPDNFELKPVTYIENWIQGFYLLRANSPKFFPGDIRNFFLPTRNHE